MIEREAGWAHLEDAVPHDWDLGHIELDVLTGVWTLTARPRSDRRAASSIPYVTGIGRGELEAVRDLTARLKEWLAR